MVFFASFYALPLEALPGALLAMAMGLIVSYAVGFLFFNRLRLAASLQFGRRMDGHRPESRTEAHDNSAEDELAEQFHREQDSPGSGPDR
ncbi:hypothetical protein [Nesterenkonia pannonica]|uniref:hypothetical protein n=1 Tax=Nesterenkonia pannonica TaxID=1548602 RepID=UPI002164A675|nr:hypothetical protein [Nesterenkonia pannonica]